MARVAENLALLRHEDARAIGETTMTTIDKTEAIKRLRKDYGVKPGTKIYTTVKHVARSGMSRTISLYVVRKGEILDITSLVARAVGYSMDHKRWGIRSHGCGMDMCFEAVYNLGCAMWPKGTPKPHSTRNGKPDNSGGYALKKHDI
jgi:hypothetical protein